MAENFFALISRMRYIDRWCLMRSTVRENVQEHSHMVAVLAHALAVIRRDVFHGEVDVGAVTVAALYHDAPEILTGDMPTPVKYQNPAIRDAYKQVEELSVQKLLSMLPEQLRASYEDVLREGGENGDIRALVKAADKLSAYIKCIEEGRAGNGEFRQAAVQTRAILDESPLPEVQYFMEHFIEGFGLTLDELK